MQAVPLFNEAVLRYRYRPRTMVLVICLQCCLIYLWLGL